MDRLLEDVGKSPVPDPGEDYWQDFAIRVHGRLARAEARGRVPSRRRVPMGPAWTAWSAAAAALVLAALPLLWWLRGGPAGPGGAEAELAALEERLDAALQGASEEELDAVDTLALLPIVAGQEAEAELRDADEEALMGSAEALEAAGELAAALGTEGFTEWGRVDRLLDHLDSDEAAWLMEDLAPEGSRLTPEGEGVAG